MTAIPSTEMPRTSLDAYFAGPATVHSKLRLDINGTLLSDAAIQRLAGCPAGGEVFLAQDDQYLDYIRFAERCPKNFGAVVLLRMAHEARQLGFVDIELLAAGGSGVKGNQWTEKFWGYEVWPRLGFDTVLQPAILDRIKTVPHLQGMTRVSQIIQADLQWWKDHGDGWDMKFDLAPGSASWTTLHQYCVNRGLLK